MKEFTTLLFEKKYLQRLNEFINTSINIENKIIFISVDKEDNVIGYVHGRLLQDQTGIISDIKYSSDYSDTKIEESLLCMITDYFRTQKCKNVILKLESDSYKYFDYDSKNLLNIFK